MQYYQFEKIFSQMEKEFGKYLVKYDLRLIVVATQEHL
jgi:hypothetical protein